MPPVTNVEASGVGTTESPRVATSAALPLPIAVAAAAAADQATSFDLPPGRYALVVSSLAREGSFDIALEAQGIPANQVRAAPLADDGPRLPPRLLPPPPSPPGIDNPPAALASPPLMRSFSLMVREGDVASAGNYHTVQARLRAVGGRVQVYVDTNDISRVNDLVLRDVAQTFDQTVYPTVARLIGVSRDLDGDGRFTVLISSWLGRLSSGKLAVDGFVRGADFDPALGAPFGNRCDMMYLNANFAPGPYLRTVIAHEYTHAVTFSSKSYIRDLDGPRQGPEPPREHRHGNGDGPGHDEASQTQGGWRFKPGAEEEGWLDEAVAHLVEDLHGFSRANLDYRVSAFLNAPERYRLVVEDYYAADLFRSHGNRGSTYLFLRWCAERIGPELVSTLVRSDQRGLRNLERAAGQTFPALYRAWSVDLARSGLLAPSTILVPERPAGSITWPPIDLRGILGEWVLAGPRMHPLAPDGVPRTVKLGGTTSHYVTLTPVGNQVAGWRIQVRGPSAAELQLTAIPLPLDLPDLTLSARPVTLPATSPGSGSASEGSQAVMLELLENRGMPVKIRDLAWEPLIPPADPRENALHRGRLLPGQLSRSLGGSLDVPAGGRLATSTPLILPGLATDHPPLILKVVGIDQAGRRVSAWAELR